MKFKVFGMPRSGTHFLFGVFKGTCSVELVTEGHPNHPLNNPNWLNAMKRCEYDHLYLVRSKRHPVDCIESRLAMWPGMLDAPPDDIKSLPSYLKRYRIESERFREAMDSEHNDDVTFAEMLYDDLGRPDMWAKLFVPFHHVPEETKQEWVNRLKSNWMNPKRMTSHASRFREGTRQQRKLGNEIIQKILWELQDVIQAEGLVGKSRYMRLSK